MAQKIRGNLCHLQISQKKNIIRREFLSLKQTLPAISITRKIAHYRTNTTKPAD
jgi:hypothetical protein